ncbi:FAD-dependent oxidoreductase domain-containing protein 2 [Cololabis saira]|uniref:FAD-dependent oxidoreductase domain-containing protein 2 n=1 Tax=Cololabis saira TaxID=129043 RepID=UPI002AD50FA5|nr:FAD-dependent oxidoreductase domain-containing protein 2 [Cololabis saira]XP_061567116.1 FAD-dependent oxidoreductase domain-containing protein 2 [Cololabis saira]
MEPRLPCFILFTLVGFVSTSYNHPRHNATHHYEYCVLGAGPAGLQMGHFLSKAGRDYIIMERNSGPGSFFNKYPRHRKLISINKVYTGRRNREFNLRHDWNSLLSDKPDLLFRRVSTDFYPPADAFPLYLSMFVKELGLKVRYGVDIGRIRALQSATGSSYVLTDQHAADYTCSVLLVATGLWVPQKVEFVGSDLVEGYESISTNPDDYQDQAVLILGKGNSAFETAQSILGRASRVHMLSSSPVRLAWQTHYVGDLRAVNNELIDTYQLKSLDGLVEARLEKIVIAQQKEQGRRRSGGKNEKKKGQLYLSLNKYVQNRREKNGSYVTREELPGHHIDNFPMRKPYDRVIRCLGFRFNFSIFDSSACPPNSENAKGRLPGVTAWYEGRSTPDLFVLGTASHSRDYRASAGGFVHGFRYTARAVHRVLEHRHHGNLWPSTRLLTTQLHSWILKRIGEASGPYQMFETLGDVILLRGSHCEYVEEFLLQALPQFVSLSGHEVSSHGLIVVVMQYGKKKIDYLGRGRAETDWTKAWKSNFLHPVLYYYDRLPTEEEVKMRPHGWPLPRPRAIHHMVEDFLTEWEGPLSHIQPLRRFLERCVQTDLRAFYAESCFRFALTHRKPPLFCQQGYLRGQGLPRDSRPWQQPHDSRGIPPEQDDAGAAESDPSPHRYLVPAGASVSSGLKLDF